MIDPSQIKDTNKVTFGATVTLVNLDTDQEITITIVDEADLSKGLIAYNSPTARACIGKEADSIIDVKAPAGGHKCEITKIEYIL